MAQTRWYPMARTPRTWILANGDTVTEPVMEETEAKRKARTVEEQPLAGSTKLADRLAYTSVVNEAQRRGTQILCEALPADEQGRWIARPAFHIARSPAYMATDTAFTAWWLYRHPTLPIEIMIELSMRGCVFPEHASRPRDAYLEETTHISRPLFPAVVGAGWNVWDDKPGLAILPRSTDAGLSLKTARFVHNSQSNPPPWDALHSVKRELYVNDSPSALRAWLARAEEIGHRQITLPTGAPDAPMMEFDLVETNLTDEDRLAVTNIFINNDLAEEAIVAYEALCAVFAKAGMVLTTPQKSDFLQMLSNGKSTRVRLPRNRLLSAARVDTSGYGDRVHLLETDERHTVSLDLATGTMYVHCGLDGVALDREAIIESWDRAQAVASITGTTEDLNEHARTFAKAKAMESIALAKHFDRRAF